MTKVRHIVLRILAGVLIILLLGIVLLQVPKVQNAIIGKVLDSVSSRFDGKITVGKVKLLPFRTLVIRDVTFTDNSPMDDSFFPAQDTIARVGYAAVSFSLKGILGGKEGIVLNRVTIRDGMLTFVAEGNHMHNIKRVLRKGTPHPMKDKGDVLLIKKIDVRDFRFKMYNVSGEDKEWRPEGIRWYDLDATADAKARNFHICDACVSATVDDLSLHEKSGYSAWNVRGRAIIHSGNIQLSNLHLEDGRSMLNVPKFSMIYDNYLAFRDFTRKVSLSGQIRNTQLDTWTLSYLTPVQEMPLDLSINEASFNGTVNNMKLHYLDFSEAGGISGKLSGKVSNLTDIRNAAVDAEIDRLEFNTGEVTDLIKAFAPESKVNIGTFATGERLTLTGSGKGPLNDMRFIGTLKSGLGRADCNMLVSNLMDSETPATLEGRLSTVNLDLGRIINTDFIHECTLGARLKATLSNGGSSVRLDSLGISRLNLKDYDYTGLTAAGTFSNREFNGRIICSDPNLNFLLQGVFNLSKKTNNALYNFVFSLGYADLNALHLDKRGTSKVSLLGNANFMRVVKGDLIGNIAIRDVMLENREGKHHIGDIDVNSYSNNGDYRINFTSSFANGDYTGTKPFTAMLDAIKETTLRKELPSLAGARPQIWEHDSYTANFKFFNTGDLLSFVKPGLYIAEGTTLKLGIDKEGTFSAAAKSQRLAFRDKFLKDLDIKADDSGEALKIAANSSELKFSAIRVLDNKIQIKADQDHTDLSLLFDNGKGTGTEGAIHLAFDFGRDDRDSLIARLTTLPSSFSIQGEEWGITPAAVTLNRGDISISGLRFFKGEQALYADGMISRDATDTLSINLEKFDISTFAPLLGDASAIGGIATGHAMLISPIKEKTGLRLDMACDSTSFNGYDAGKLRLRSAWSDEEKKMIFRLTNDMDGKSTINASGAYNLTDSSLDAGITLDGMELGYAGGFLKSILSEMSGKASGKISLSGPVNGLAIRSRDARLDDAVLRVAYTNVPYYLSGPFHIDENGLVFDDISLKDRFKGTGTVSGGINFSNLTDLRMATDIRVNGVEAFNTTASEDAPVYGNVSASGTVTFRGPLSDLIMDVNAITSGGGSFHIPLKSESSAVGTDILTFKQPETTGWVDPYEQMIRRLEEVEKEKSSFGIRMTVGIRPELTCNLDLDQTSGNSLSGHGRGTVSLDIEEGKDFSINGDYTLNDGRFKFSAMGIATREFTIKNGSSVKFNGDIMDSDLDIDAVYSTKASLATLIADTTSVSSRRTVECGLQITDKLRNPRLAFNLNIPDLDPSTKSLVESALSTEDKVQKQFLSLLVTNSFLPSDQSGIVNNTDLLFSNVSEIMAGQLNNILQRLEIPLDLGLKYQPNEGGTDIFDVALSTQLFNNRVSVNGNIGNRQYMAGSQQDVVGDLDIDMKVDKAGAVRVSMFSHSADQYSNYLDYSQRNGVGISYQKEFNTFKGFFKELFSTRKAREQRLLELIDTDKVTIKIQPKQENE